MNKVIIKSLKILLIFSLLIICLSANCIGIDTNITIGGTSAINVNKDATEKIVGIVQVIGSVISVAALVIIGFRYMLSSLEEKAAMKGILVYYVIGAVLVFATSNILSVVYNVIKNIKM